jgi:hypothetical protein
MVSIGYVMIQLNGYAGSVRRVPMKMAIECSAKPFGTDAVSTPEVVDPSKLAAALTGLH